MRVLVVDDSGEVRRRLAALLAEIAGVDEVVEAEGVADGIAAARASEPSVVVLDLNLRGDSGLTLLPALRRERPEALLVVLTNHASAAHRAQCRASGADYFFDKSTEFERVVPIVGARAATSRRR